MSNIWKKIENEAGYPCYVISFHQQYDHPKFQTILKTLNEYDDMKYSAYRVAFKIYCLQKQLKVPPLRISAGVLARHRLSLSESSLSLDAAELEAVLADIYFAAKKEGLFTGDIDLTVDLLVNLLLNIYDRERKEPLRVLAAKTLLILLSEESTVDKWIALANCAADHNGCVSPRRLATLLNHIMALPLYLGEKDCGQLVQEDVDGCFTDSAGMLGVSATCVAEWGSTSSLVTRWIQVLSRIHSSRLNNCSRVSCSACRQAINQVLRFKCAKCIDFNLCEKCYLYDNMVGVSGHKKTHIVREIIDGEITHQQCVGFIKEIKKLFFCTKTKKKKVSKKKRRKEIDLLQKDREDREHVKNTKDGKPTIFTSTVGKASGHSTYNPLIMSQDIINHLENHNKALKQLFTQLNDIKDADDSIKQKIDLHLGQIATQIGRLKVLKEHLPGVSQPLLKDGNKNKEKKGDIPEFDLFSPIPVMNDENFCKVSDKLKSQPRVLNLESKDSSSLSKSSVGEQPMIESGHTIKPVVHTSDSISTVLMNDISLWHNNDAGSHTVNEQVHKSGYTSILPADNLHLIEEDKRSRTNSLCVTEERFDADLRSVTSSNDKMKGLYADMDTVLNRLHQILSHNFAMDDANIDNSQLRETANEMEGLLGTLIRGVEERVTLKSGKLNKC